MTPWLQDADVTLYHGDVLNTLRELPAESVDCVVTSPPYWGLRDYGQEGQLGLEPTPEQYVERMVEVFREVRRVLAAHGTVWLNLGDSYANAPASAVNRNGMTGTLNEGRADFAVREANIGHRQPMKHGLKPKDLVGVPWRVAFALQADGWYLRSDIIWAKPNPMPESVTDRPTKAHEYVFLLSKQPRYFFDQEAVREGVTGNTHSRGTKMSPPKSLVHEDSKEKVKNNRSFMEATWGQVTSRNIRSVWEIATQPYPEAHFATFPEELARRCIAAGCPEWVCRACGKARERVVSATYDNEGRTTNGPRSLEQRHETAGFPVRKVKFTSTEGFTDCGHADYRPGIVLDPFMGSGTMAFVARKLGRHAVGIDLSESYLELAARRLQQQSLFAVME